MDIKFTIDEIMDRLSRICRKNKVCVRIRPSFPSGSKKWYVNLEGVLEGTVESGGYGPSLFDGSGATPDEAIFNAWKLVLSLEKNKICTLVRINCPSNTPVPDKEPQVWLRWNSKLDDWEDVPVPRLPPERLRTYKDQLWRDNN